VCVYHWGVVGHLEHLYQELQDWLHWIKGIGLKERSDQYEHEARYAVTILNWQRACDEHGLEELQWC